MRPMPDFRRLAYREPPDDDEDFEDDEEEEEDGGYEEPPDEDCAPSPRATRSRGARSRRRGNK